MMFLLLDLPLSQGLFPLNFSVSDLVLREHSRSLFIMPSFGPVAFTCEVGVCRFRQRGSGGKRYVAPTFCSFSAVKVRREEGDQERLRREGEEDGEGRQLSVNIWTVVGVNGVWWCSTGDVRRRGEEVERWGCCWNGGGEEGRCSNAVVMLRVRDDGSSPEGRKGGGEASGDVQLWRCFRRKEIKEGGPTTTLARRWWKTTRDRGV
ncbi:hypothetical protein HAX54_001180 [Datura stramonium]|uniref:Uncharacterized protein n=1 Tax=Datura stramonium TaxID=4076 RepID=A0ABS8T1Y5_DATST|nr:hypothetical protein [Datura stramonium]